MQAPPTALIFSSAILKKNLAFTIICCLGRQHTSAEDFEVTTKANVNDGRFLIILVVFNSGLFGNKRSQLDQIDGRNN